MRLTTIVKDQIIRNALKAAGIYKRREALDATENKLAERARVIKLGGTAKVNTLEKLELKYNAMLKSMNLSRYHNYSHRIQVSSVTGGYHLMLSFATSNWCTSGALQLEIDTPLMKSILKWSEDTKQLNDERDTIKSDVRTLLNSVTTDKQLLKIWPEAVELLPPEATKTQLPSVATDQLNKLLRLPS